MDKVQFVFLDLLVFAHSFHVNFFGQVKCHEKCLYGVGGGECHLSFKPNLQYNSATIKHV